MTERPRVSVVIPAYNEGDRVISVLDRLFESVRLPCEVLLVVDSADDTTVPVAEEYAQKEPRLKCLVNTYGRGPANAIRFGFDAAAAPVTVVTMADGCDDARQIDDLVRLVERGVAVAAASRYMPGGQQVGGPVLKANLSRLAGRSLRVFAHVGTRDATNSFKAYSTEFVRRVGIDSRDGFEIGIELTAKAKRLRLPVAEIPTIWLDRQAGVSNFKVAKWVPSYVRWYRFAFGPQLTAEQVRGRAPVRQEAPGATDKTGGLMDQVLVSGSAGFIGGYVVEELLKRGYSVIGLDNFSKYGKVRKSYDDNPNYRLIEGDAKDVDLMKELLADCDHFVAGAAMIGGISYFHTFAYDLLAENERMTAASLTPHPARRTAASQDHQPVLVDGVRERRRVAVAGGSAAQLPPPLRPMASKSWRWSTSPRPPGTSTALPYTIVRPFNCVGIGESRALSDHESCPGTCGSR